MTSVVLFKTVSNILYLPTTLSVWQQKTFFYNQSHHLIYQYSTKLFFYFLTTLYCTWNYTFIKNCMEKTRLTWGSILRPPDNLIFGRLLFLHVIIFHLNFALKKFYNTDRWNNFLTPLRIFLQQNAQRIDKTTNMDKRTPWMMASSENDKEGLVN